MPTDGSGNYSLPDGSVAVNGEVIEAATHNTPLNDIAAGLTARVMRNGSAPMTDNLRMGDNRITGLLAGSASGHAVEYDQYRTAASETVSGIAELATQAEAEAGADDARIVTPLKAKQAIQFNFGTDDDIWAGTANKIVTTDDLVDAGAFVALSDGATIATDCATGRNFAVTIADDRTLANPTNVKVGQVYSWKITQGVGAPNTLAFAGNFDFGDAEAPTLSTSEGDVDLVQFFAISATKFAYLGTRLGV